MAPGRRSELAPRRLSDEIASYVRSQIFSGEMGPGDRLFEVELSHRLNVSRAPLREALVRLQKEGLIDIRPNRGAVVVELTDDDIRETFELRKILDPFAASAAARRADQEAIKALKRTLDAMRVALDQEDPLETAVAHANFHREVGVASGLPRTAGFIDSLCTLMLASHGFGYAEHMEQVRTLIGEHEPIFAAIARGDSFAAAELSSIHFSPVDPMLDSYRKRRKRAPQGSADFAS